MTSSKAREPEFARQLDKAVARLRAEWGRFEAGQASDLENALQDLEQTIAGLKTGAQVDGTGARLPIANAICELESVRGKLARQLEATAQSLRATQGQRRAFSAYAKANRT